MQKEKICQMWNQGRTWKSDYILIVFNILAELIEN